MREQTFVSGKMRGDVVHIGKHILTAKSGVKLYEAICTKMRIGFNTTYLVETNEIEPITCKKCLAKQSKYPDTYKV